MEQSSPAVRPCRSSRTTGLGDVAKRNRRFGIDVRRRRRDRFVAETKQPTAAVFCVTRRSKTVKVTRACVRLSVCRYAKGLRCQTTREQRGKYKGADRR